MKAYKLKFHSSFHLDSGTAVDGPSEIFIKSDTLFSAICSAADKFYGSVVVEEFLKPDSLILSSAFPFLNDEYFFPRPLNYYPNIDNNETIKDFKKIKFVSKEYLEEIINHKEINHTFINKNYILNGCWRTQKSKEDDLIFETNENPHVIVDRISNSTQIFYKTEVYFGKDAGLFFLANVKNELINKFESVLRFIGDEGIGADRTIGKGLFEVEEIKDFSLKSTAAPDSYYSLSLYSPSEKEFNAILPKESFYEFDIRKGWLSNNTLRRKSLRMFAEGSIIKFNTNLDPKGSIQLVLSKDDYPDYLQNNIYRSGQAMFIPFLGGINGNN
jgi:CRISPR-associated protein Csm4